MEWLRLFGHWIARLFGYLSFTRKLRKELHVIHLQLDHERARAAVLRQIYDQPLWETDATGRNTWVNERFSGMLGRGQEHFEGYDWYWIIHQEDRDKVMAGFMESVERRTLYRAEFRMLKHDGQDVIVRIVGYPMTGHGGKIWGWFGNALPQEKA